jgi:hypothetical protein
VPHVVGHGRERGERLGLRPFEPARLDRPATTARSRPPWTTPLRAARTLARAAPRPSHRETGRVGAHRRARRPTARHRLPAGGTPAQRDEHPLDDRPARPGARARRTARASPVPPAAPARAAAWSTSPVDRSRSRRSRSAAACRRTAAAAPALARGRSRTGLARSCPCARGACGTALPTSCPAGGPRAARRGPRGCPPRAAPGTPPDVVPPGPGAGVLSRRQGVGEARDALDVLDGRHPRSGHGSVPGTTGTRDARPVVRGRPSVRTSAALSASMLHCGPDHASGP